MYLEVYGTSDTPIEDDFQFPESSDTSVSQMWINVKH